MAEWQVRLLRDARRYLDRLGAADQDRILSALQELTADVSRAKPLHGRPERSLRVGGYRVLVRPDEAEHTVYVVRIGPRGDVYKGPT